MRANSLRSEFSAKLARNIWNKPEWKRKLCDRTLTNIVNHIQQTSTPLSQKPCVAPEDLSVVHYSTSDSDTCCIAFESVLYQYIIYFLTDQ